MPLPQLSLAVVGADHPNRSGPARRFEIAMCSPGEPVKLRPEPQNKVDERAVAVFSARDIQIGYLTAERCGRIGQLIKSGRAVTAIFQEATPYGAAIRVGFDGDEPVLPWKQDEFPANELWPDEVWPDD